MNNLIRGFLDGLRDRLIASMGSVIGSTFTAFRTAHQAETQSFLEDLARQYEAEGKNQLAENVRQQAANLNMDDPGTEARIVFQNVLDDRKQLPVLSQHPDHAQEASDSGRAVPKKGRRTKKRSTPNDDMGISLD